MKLTIFVLILLTPQGVKIIENHFSSMKACEAYVTYKNLDEDDKDFSWDCREFNSKPKFPSVAKKGETVR